MPLVTRTATSCLLNCTWPVFRSNCFSVFVIMPLWYACTVATTMPNAGALFATSPAAKCHKVYAKTCHLWQICVQGTFGNLVKPASATAFVVGVPDANLDTINVGNNLAIAIALQVAALGDCGVTPNLIIVKHISSPVPCAIAQPQQRCSSTGPVATLTVVHQSK